MKNKIQQSQWLPMTDVLVNIGQIEGLPANPRIIHDTNFKKLVKSINDDPEMLELRELLVYPHNNKYIVIGGNMRLEAMRVIGYDSVPCKIIDTDTSVEKLKAYLIKDNVSGGEWDFELLANDWDIEQLSEWGLDIPPFDLLESSEEREAFTDEDDVPEQSIEPKSKLGDVWLLGKHRLMCGDSTSIDDVEKLINSNAIDMILTDPPYGMHLDTDFSSMQSKIHGNKCGNTYSAVIGDNEDFIPEIIHTIFTIEAKEIFIFGFDYFAEHIPNRNKGSVIVWDKRITEEMDRGFGSCFELCWSKNKHKREFVRLTWAGIFGMGQNDEKNRIHPTQKPIKLIEWFLEKFSEKSHVILDFYGGSGSTLIACEKTNRINYSMELDPKYCDVIIKRWQNYTKEEAILESTKQKFNEL